MEKVRLVDIAAAAGVSKVTASKVLNPSPGNNTTVSASTRERILGVAARLGYRVNIAASQLAGGRSRMLGVLIDARTSPMEFQRVAYAEEAASRLGYRFMIGQCKADLNNIKAYIDDFADRGIEGVILHSNSFPNLNRQIVEYARRIRHVLYYDRPISDDGSCDYVDVDLAAGMRQLVDHLAQEGRTRIAYFLPYETFHCGKYPSTLAREKGFIEGMQAHNLPFDPGFANRFVFERFPSVEELMAIIERFIREEKPDAIIARNDSIAAIVLRTMHEMGVRCPDDIALAGYDNTEFSQYLYPPLTTVDNLLAQISGQAVRILVDRIEGRSESESPLTRTFTPQLIIRGSTRTMGKDKRR